jgi:RNA polymerase sigma factor (sigma-70 family)
VRVERARLRAVADVEDFIAVAGRDLGFPGGAGKAEGRKQKEESQEEPPGHAGSKAPIAPWARRAREISVSNPKKPGHCPFKEQGNVNNEPEKSHARNEASSLVQAAVERHQAPLLRYAARLLGGDADRARDVVQDTFVRLMAQPPAQVDGHVAEWLFTVCRNRTLDVLRKEGRMKRFEEGQAERLTAPGPLPGHTLERVEQHETVLRLIGKLPHNQQEVVRLKFQNGFSYQEISRITSLSVTNVGFILHTALKALRRDMIAQPE